MAMGIDKSGHQDMAAQICDLFPIERWDFHAAAHFSDAAIKDSHSAVLYRRASDRNYNAGPKDHSVNSAAFS